MTLQEYCSNGGVCVLPELHMDGQQVLGMF